jgi:uncharacterized membrane protein
MTMLFHDLSLFYWVYLVLLFLQIIALTILVIFSQKFKFIRDAGWGFARFVVLLILSFIVWQLGHLKLAINTSEGVYLIFSLMFFVSALVTKKILGKDKKVFAKFFRKYKKIILIEELLFLLAMIFLLAMRSFQPEILGLEKFMDAGFIQSYLKSPTLPVKDIWLANADINYYSFGQFYNSILVQLWRIDLAYAYNFLLAAIFAIFSVELFSLAFNLRANLDKKKFLQADKYDFKAALISGFLAVFLIALGGNGHTLWYFFKNAGFDAYWYPDATRFIERTIHEFPAYSFVVCDLHAHVLSLPLTVLLFFNIFVWTQEIFSLKKFKFSKLLKEKFFYLALFLGFLFGILAMTNTWDMMVYGVLLIILSLLILAWQREKFWSLFTSALLILGMTATTVLFWYLNFEAIAQGLLVTTEKTPFWQLLVLWGPHLILALSLLVVLFNFLRKNKVKKSVSFLLIAVFVLVLFLIIFPEFFYFKDIYTSYQRANTMFKLVFQAFMLLGIVIAVLLTKFLSFAKSKKRRKKLFILYLPVAVLIFFSAFAYPFLAYKSYYGAWRNYQGLDGLAWLERTSPDDYQIVEYLKDNENTQVNIVEAVGESYSQFARISAFSGMPTILGWRVHEWLWRGGWDIPGARTAEVEKIYTDPQSALSQSYLEKYQIKYIVLGDKEREAYSVDTKSLLNLGEIHNFGQSFLIELD